MGAGCWWHWKPWNWSQELKPRRSSESCMQNADFCAPAKTYRVWISWQWVPSILYFNKLPEWFLVSLKLENCWKKMLTELCLSELPDNRNQAARLKTLTSQSLTYVSSWTDEEWRIFKWGRRSNDLDPEWHMPRVGSWRFPTWRQDSKREGGNRR